jgi:hypothetical protein
MKRITKYQKADKLATKLTAVKTIAMLGKGYSKHYTEILIRQAYMKGHKAGMARQRRINLNKEFYKRMRLINENIVKAMG